MDSPEITVAFRQTYDLRTKRSGLSNKHLKSAVSWILKLLLMLKTIKAILICQMGEFC